MLWHEMIRIRRFEETLARLHKAGQIPGTLHLSIGQEAVPVGVSSQLTMEDTTLSNHRGHGHLLSRGQDMGPLLAEIMGQSSGICGGWGGTQHLCNMSLGHLGSNGIIGGGSGVAAGVALAKKKLGKPGVVVYYIGDGALGQGILWESFNIANIFSLPLIYVCENNQYAMSTPISRSHYCPLRQLQGHILTIEVDGQDPHKVSTQMLIAKQISEYRPVLLFCNTYRLCGHSVSDKNAYRPKGEEEQWRKRDPVDAFKPENSAAIEEEVQDEIQEALKFCGMVL